MKVKFLGATHEVTGSCSMIDAAGKKILVDCGMEQGIDIYENCELPVSPAEIDAVILTHAHIDHSGKIPALVANGFKGPVFSTEATYKLCSIMLLDSAHIQEFEAEWRNRKAKRRGTEEYVPPYTVKDAEKAISLFRYMPYHKKTQIFDGIEIEFFDAGHLLGSSSVKLSVTEDKEQTSIIFSGDLGNIDRPLIRDPESPDGADYVVIESTYGDRIHGDRPDYITQLSDIMNETFSRGGNVIIPSFAVGRTQELLYLIRTIKEKNLVNENFSVYVDSPLAVEATSIYSSGLNDYYDSETLDLLSNGIDPINFAGLKLSITSDDSKAINFDDKPKVILSASGMCEAGRIRHHLKHNLWRNDSTILFVGYQSEGTVGRKLVDGAKAVKLFGEEITVNARIATMTGISGHADRDMMTAWLNKMTIKPKKVFVNHGEDTVCDLFASHITDTLGIPADAPFSGDAYDLSSGECIEKGTAKKQDNPRAARQRAEQLFGRLLSAGKRLMAVIDKNKGAPNKELAKFTDQINNLCDRYDK